MTGNTVFSGQGHHHSKGSEPHITLYPEANYALYHILGA